MEAIWKKRLQSCFYFVLIVLILMPPRAFGLFFFRTLNFFQHISDIFTGYLPRQIFMFPSKWYFQLFYRCDVTCMTHNLFESDVQFCLKFDCLEASVPISFPESSLPLSSDRGPCCPFLPPDKGNEDSGNEIASASIKLAHAHYPATGSS